MADVLISEFMDRGVAEGLIAEFDTHWIPTYGASGMN